MKKYLVIILSVIIFAGIYLYGSHVYFYKKLAMGGLKFFDWQNEIVMGEGMVSIKYTALGDSLTAGAGAEKREEAFPYLIAQKLRGQDTILFINRSIPGYRTEDVIEQFLEKAVADQPDIVTLLVGTNDIHGFIPAEDFRKNFDFILKRLTTETKAKINVISIPALGADSLILPPWNSYFDKQIKNFNVIIKELAGNHKVNYIDLYTPTFINLKNEGAHYSRDLFHPSAQGYADWAKIIYDNLDR